MSATNIHLASQPVSAPAERGRRTTLQTTLLLCGIAAPVLYVATDVVAAMRWDGYSFRDQTISELNAIGAPTRSFTIAMGLMGYSVLTAFGIGVWRAAARSRRLRVAGGALTALGLQALWAVPFASMHVRGVERSFSDTLHLVDGAVAGVLFVTAVGLAAAAFGRRFRLYSLATLVVVLGFVFWSGADASRVADDLATPWLGIKERIGFYSYQAWFAGLAVTLLRSHLPVLARRA